MAGESYELIGVPFAKRGKRIDRPSRSCVAPPPAITSGPRRVHHDIPKTKMTPAPRSPIPILVGGAPMQLRRAARRWMVHGGGDPDELDRLIARVKRLRGEAGKPARSKSRDLLDGFTVDGVKRLEDKGVTDVSSFPCPITMGPDTEPLSQIRNQRCSPRTSSRK